jgi:hypothetical protein
MKKTVFVLVMLFFLLSTALADTFHYYFNGKVAGISETSIQIGKRVYAIAPGSRVVVQDKRNGAIYEEPARVYSINPGDSVTVRVEGSTVNEILIERWRR